MIEHWNQWQLLAALGGAGFFLLLDLLLSVALISASLVSRMALHRMRESDGRLAFLEHLKRPSSSYRAAAVILRQLSLLGAILLVIIGGRAAGWRFPAVLGVGLGALVGVLVLEAVVARSIAVWNPRAALRSTAFAIRGARALLFPFVEPLATILDRLGRSQRLSDEQREEEQDEEVEALIEVGEREGLLEASEGEMMRGIVDLDETPVREIMTPRPDIVALPLETTVAEARRAFLDAGHSRLPVYRESIDHVVGVLHSRDLFRAWEEKKEAQSISRYLRSATFVPETLSAAELLADMRQKTHLSLVVDEYGGIAGLVTLEDLLEEIVGDIRDEHETDEQPVVGQRDGSYVITAATHVEELEQLFGIDIGERDFDTVGGLVVYGFGRVPSAGEFLEVHGLRIEILKADKRRVHQVRALVLRDAGEAGTG